MSDNTVRAHYVDGLLELIDPLPATTARGVQVILDSGEPIDPKEARKRMERAAGSWQKYFDEDPSLMDLYRQCSCCPSAVSDR